jgi:hypothetical protein
LNFLCSGKGTAEKLNNLNENIFGLLIGVIMFIAVILFMVSVIYFEIIFLIILKKFERILKRKDKSSDSENKDK